MTGTLHYPDIASFDKGIDFSTSYVVMAKATQGTWYTDPYYAQFKQFAAQHNVYFCAYHFLEAGNGAAQAQAYAKVIGKGVPGMLDIESTNRSRPTVADAVDFLNECHTLGIAVYLCYLPHWYWQTILGMPSLKPLANLHQSLVSSNYTTYSDTGPGWNSYGGMAPAVWQYADNVPYGGIQNVDFNAFKGSDSGDLMRTLEEFKSLVTTGSL